MGLEPKIPGFERAKKIDALDRATTVHFFFPAIKTLGAQVLLRE
jgi:hypothetical protein